MSNLFSMKVGRPVYWMALVALWLVNGTIAFVAPVPEIQLPVLVVTGLPWLLVVAGRFRDMAMSPWMALTTFIPLIGFFVVLYAGVAKPKDETTEGEDNKGFAR